jgi:hypothetical protein
MFGGGNPADKLSIRKKGVAEGSENNSTVAQKIFFARSNKTPKGWSYDHVGFITQDGKQIQMSGHKGNDVYVTNDVTDDPEFPNQHIKIVSLSKPVLVPTINSVGAENCGTFVANVLQANGIKGIDTQTIYSVFKKPQEQNVVNEDWNKVNHHDHTNGLSQKAVNSYRHEHPGSHLQTAVTTKPSKLKAGSKAAKRRKSFCARMSGNKGPMKTPSGKPTPKALALRRWHCESIDELYITATQRIYEAEGEPSGLKHLTPHLARDILDQMEKEGVHAIVKSIEWGDGGAKELINIIKRELQRVAGHAKVDEEFKYPFAGSAVGQKAGPAGQLKGKDKGRKDGKQPAFNKLVGGN